MSLNNAAVAPAQWPAGSTAQRSVGTACPSGSRKAWPSVAEDEMAPAQGPATGNPDRHVKVPMKQRLMTDNQRPGHAGACKILQS